ncbi:hypothetical protein C5E06_09370 [Pseudoclavibacter sp. RFBI5]|uniref:DNA adenine methylase n=1 Tax=Pseudoclavibacter sp. RFBI5 TaxID=2080578 RepID=UPI000CE8A7D3|nr:DNA adenine methylase [Pseudoclavibacter sp. RFBI5]PPG02652.1 hypothetical protein C5E06_09370 [Pseudoclavibacter sp. RFBI5]
MTTRHASPLRYPGGKARMSTWLADRMGETRQLLETEVWIEPFAGGLGAALTALLGHDVPEVWAAELNPALHAFWTSALCNSDLADRVAVTVPTLDLYFESRDLVAAALAGEQIPVDKLGYAAFVVNRCSRSGILTANVGPMGGKAQSEEWRVGSRFTADRLAARLRTVAGLGRSGRLQLLGGDGIDLIELLPGSGVEHESFLFVDPPYVGVGNALYAAGMDAQLHLRLATALERCTTPWVLTYDEHPDVREPYRDFAITRFQIPHAAHLGKIGAEYLITSPQIADVTTNPLGKGSAEPVAVLQRNLAQGARRVGEPAPRSRIRCSSDRYADAAVDDR